MPDSKQLQMIAAFLLNEGIDTVVLSTDNYLVLGQRHSAGNGDVAIIDRKGGFDGETDGKDNLFSSS